MLQFDNFKDQVDTLWRVVDSIRQGILNRFALDDAVAKLVDPPILPVGGSSGIGEENAVIKLTLGTFLYLLDEVPLAFRFAPVAQFAQGQKGDASTSPDAERVKVFTYVLGAVAISILTAHELCHALNGHFYIENYSKSPIHSEELGIEARRLKEDDATSLAIEFNADLAGIAWTLEALFDQSSELYQLIKEAEDLLPGITSPAGLGSIFAFVIVILGKTYRNGQRAKLRHPGPSFRVKGLKKAVAWFLKTNKKEAELDSFLHMFPVAVDFIVPNLRPTVTDFTQAQSAEPGDLPSRIQQAWRKCEPFLGKHKKGPTICFGAEMHDWTNTLDL